MQPCWVQTPGSQLLPVQLQTLSSTPWESWKKCPLAVGSLSEQECCFPPAPAPPAQSQPLAGLEEFRSMEGGAGRLGFKPRSSRPRAEAIYSGLLAFVVASRVDFLLLAAQFPVEPSLYSWRKCVLTGLDQLQGCSGLGLGGGFKTIGNKGFHQTTCLL